MEIRNCPFCGQKPKVYGYVEYDRDYEPEERKVTKVKCVICKITLPLEIWNGPPDKKIQNMHSECNSKVFTELKNPKSKN